MDKVNETINLFDRFSTGRRSDWIIEVEQDSSFRFGNQWTEQQIKEMNEKGHPPVAINRIHPAIEMSKAILTSNRPSFRVSPREDSDNQLAQALNGLLQYTWQISDSDMKHSEIVDDMLAKGVGYWYVYIDPMADNGKGEVKLDRLRVEDVYVDPNSRDRYFRDASDIIISKVYSKGQLKRLFPEFKKAISNASGTNRIDSSFANSFNTNLVINPNDEDTEGYANDYETVRYYERYTKEFVKRWAVYEDWSGRESVLTNEEYDEYIKNPAWIINGQIYSNEQLARQISEQVMNAYNQALQNMEMAKQAVEQGQMAEEQFAQLASQLPEPPQMQQVSFLDLANMNIIRKVEITTQRVRVICVVGETLLYERILKTEDYPIVPYCNIHTDTPYPLSDVRMVKDKQKALNKINSIVLTHASLSTNGKLIVNRGSSNIKELEKRWAIPGSIHEIDLDNGAVPPIQVQPTPIPNQLFAMDNIFKNDIDHEFGIYESMMGNAQQSPDTYRATIAIDEFGQRKLRNKMQIIETGLVILGRIVLNFCQELYSQEKIIRLLEPNNSMSEYVVNKRLYDQYGLETIDIVNDLSRAKYDVIVVGGSTLPSNRYAQLEFYMEAYKAGIIDNVEVLKKTEIFDKEGILQRADKVQQLESALQQAQEEIKKLRGDLQTAQRQTVNANFAKINAEYKAKEHANYVEGQKQNELFASRATDALNNIKSSASVALKEQMLANNAKQNKDKK